jgi:hypothetical protein
MYLERDGRRLLEVNKVLGLPTGVAVHDAKVIRAVEDPKLIGVETERDAHRFLVFRAKLVGKKTAHAAKRAAYRWRSEVLVLNATECSHVRDRCQVSQL